VQPRRNNFSRGALLLCFALSAGLNYGVVLVGAEYFGQARPSAGHHVRIAERSSSCVSADERAAHVLTGSLSGDRGLLLDRFDELFYGVECPPEPMEVALLDEPPELEETPRELETLPPRFEHERPKPKTKKKKKPLPEEKEKEEPLPEIVPVPEPQPEPEPEPQPEEEPHEKIDFVLESLKMVEQLDQFDEEEAPEDVDYLSNINRDVAEQTRAEITNLVKDAETAEASQLEPTEVQDKGMADEDQIAELRQQDSQLAREAPQEPISPQEQRPEQSDPTPNSLLAMRDQAPRDHSEAMTRHDALASESDDGSMAPDRPDQASLEQREQQANTPSHDKKYKFRMSQKDLDSLYGLTPQAKKDYIAQRQSKRKGVWEDTRSRWQSPLENMVSEVKVGNQTALRSRKHPFARYIAQIHRKVHDLWAWGYLDQLDTRSRSHPLNDEKLWTRVEIVLHSDGRIDKIRTVRTSSNLVFDAAAREIMYASAPFPNPPRSIRSGNGKIYIQWAFHRDARACGTFGAAPFILDNAGEGARPDPNREVRGTSSETRARASRRLARNSRAGPPGPEGPSPPKSKTSSLRREPKGDHAGHAHGPGQAHAPSGIPPTPEPSLNDPDIKRAANNWLGYLKKGDIDKLKARSSVPFYAGDQIVARTQPELKGVLNALIDEARGATVSGAKLYTAAGLRKKFGSVPSGVSEGRGRIYAVNKIGGQTTILLLERRFASWRVVGLTR
jgi:TonB family protein